MHFARDGDVVWGTGRNGKVPATEHRFSKLDVRALRGPRTHEWLASRLPLPATLPYGDPALLFPYLFDFDAPLFRPREGEVGRDIVVPNLNDVTQIDGALSTRLILPTAPWYDVVRQILWANTVTTTSLHGLILAEACGKRVSRVRLSDVEPPFKYEDYTSPRKNSR
jgi:pyruvyltransferase